jgi:hypothetical protein
MQIRWDQTKELSSKSSPKNASGKFLRMTPRTKMETSRSLLIEMITRERERVGQEKPNIN